MTTSLDKQIEELIIERNDFESEAVALKSQLELIKRKWEDASGDIQILFEIQPVIVEDGSYKVDGQCVTDLMKAIMK